MTGGPARYAPRDSTDPPPRCPACRQPVGRPRATYCSPACRQWAYRRRHETRLPAQPIAAVPIVYQCPDCDQRLLGERRCAECNTFARRLGPGGFCPHCGEIVAQQDLAEA